MPTPRHEDESLLSMLRDLRRRVEELERGASSRQHDIKLGKMVLTTNPQTNKLTMKNSKTGDVTSFGALDRAEWTVLTTSSTTLPENGPPFPVNDNTVAREISLSGVLATRTTAITVTVNFPSGDTVVVTLPVDMGRIVVPIAIPVRAGQLIYPSVNSNTSSEYITVQILFGQPVGYDL